MKKHVLLYGVLAGLLIAVLQAIEYRWIVIEHSIEIYGGLIAALFAAVGIWLGLRLTRPKETVIVREVPVPVLVAAAPPPVDKQFAGEPFAPDEAQLAATGLTPRELEILALIAAGLSNREIAERIFVSENTVKTHSSRVFEKLGARRRTQAVQRGKALGLIP